MSAFETLHPAVQHHVVNSLGWKELRPFQEEAIPHVLAGAHAIIIAPTAGGKTESVILPVLSRMLSEAWDGLSVLYLCPIKALINDLGVRLDRYLSLVGRRSAIWHGDMGRSHRDRILADPPDLLLITPESLEVILTSSRMDGRTFFQGVRVVVIDEVHAFAGDDRGWHVLSLLARLSRISGREFQRLGLSATVGNPEHLLQWMTGGCDGPQLVLEPTETKEVQTEVRIDYVGSLENAAQVISRIYRSKKRLVFVDSRASAERLGAELRKLGANTFVTHSSLSREQRNLAEHAFQSAQDSVIVATSVLELGVDVGALDHVIQIDAPATVSAFLQRMGRTGRRSGAVRNCLFLATNTASLLRAAGLVELFHQGYVEPVTPPGQPYHILAQQIMALALQERGIGRHTWFEWVDSVPAFQEIEHRTRERMISWMLENKVLTEDQGILWVGEKAEETYGRKHFLELLSVFTASPTFTIFHGRNEVGFLDELALMGKGGDGNTLLLGGTAWSVKHIDWSRRQAFVEPAKAHEGRAWWPGEAPGASFAVCQAIKRVLSSAADSHAWSQRARKQIATTREHMPWLTADNTTVLAPHERGCCWWTFAGMRTNKAMLAILPSEISKMGSCDDLAIRFGPELSVAALGQAIDDLRACSLDSLTPRIDEDAMQALKFSEVIPRELVLATLGGRLCDPASITTVLNGLLRVIPA